MSRRYCFFLHSHWIVNHCVSVHIKAQKMPFCVHCTKETQLRCPCCPSTHYCGTVCQKADWEAVHRYEHHYRLPRKMGLSAGADSGGAGDTDTAKTQQGMGESEKRFQQISNDRQEHDQQIQATMTFLSQRQQTKGERKMTRKQREAIGKNLTILMGDPLEQRLSQRHHFIDHLVAMVEQFGEMPSSIEGVPARTLAITAETEADIAALFRKHDLLHLKGAHALATYRQEDMDAVSEYREYVQQEGQRLLHRLLFGDDPHVTYEAVVAKQRAALEEKLANDYVDQMLERAIESTTRMCVDYLRVMDRGGVVDDRDGDANRQQYLRNLVGMFDAQTTFSLADFTLQAESALGAYDARINLQLQAGVITEEVARNAKHFATRLWELMRPIMKRMTKEGSKKGQKMLQDMLEAIGQRYDEEALSTQKQMSLGMRTKQQSKKAGPSRWERFRQRLPNYWVMSTVALMLFIGLALFLGGLFFDAVTLGDVSRSVHDDIARVQGGLINMSDPINLMNQTQIELNGSITGLMDQYGNVADVRELLHQNPYALSIDGPGIMQVFRATLGRMRAEIMLVMSENTNNPTLNQTLTPIMQNIDDIMCATKLSYVSDRIFHLQDTLEKLVSLMATFGLAVPTQAVLSMLNAFQGITQLLGVQISRLSDMVNETLQFVNQTGANVDLMKKIALDASLDRPSFVASTLKGMSRMLGWVPESMMPLVELASSGIAMVCFSVPVQGAFSLFDDIGKQMHRLIQDSGLLSSPGWINKLIALYYFIFNWDFLWMYLYAFTAFSLLTTYFRPLAQYLLEEETGMNKLRWMAKGALNALLDWGTPYKDTEAYGEAQGFFNDYSKDAVTTNTAEQIAKARDALARGGMDWRVYGILVTIIGGKRGEDVRTGDVLMNLLDAALDDSAKLYQWMDKVSTFYILDRFRVLFFNMWHIIQCFWAVVWTTSIGLSTRLLDTGNVTEEGGRNATTGELVLAGGFTTAVYAAIALLVWSTTVLKIRNNVMVNSNSRSTVIDVIGAPVSATLSFLKRPSIKGIVVIQVLYAILQCFPATIVGDIVIPTNKGIIDAVLPQAGVRERAAQNISLVANMTLVDMANRTCASTNATNVTKSMIWLLGAFGAGGSDEKLTLEGLLGQLQNLTPT